MLLQFHAEYTSITDELESVCHMLVSPTSTISADKPRTELTKHEFAAMIEKQHLKECEDNDYEIMKSMLVARDSVDETDDSFETLTLDVTTRKVLKRDAAFEMPVTPSKSGSGFVEESEVTGSRFNRNLSADRAYPRQTSPSNLLNPAAQSMDQKLLRKSMDSLAKNSSSETEYSLHPYKVIKQSSNETNTSMTGSYNMENAPTVVPDSSSLELGDCSLNQTVIENPMTEHPGPSSTTMTRHPLKMGAAFLRKQFSTEKSIRIDPESSLQFTQSQPVMASADPLIAEHVGLEYQSESGGARKPAHVVGLQKQQLPMGSSSSTDDGRMEPCTIPAINTEVIQDEIAKLSSNIKSSTDEEREEENKTKTGAPINETMC